MTRHRFAGGFVLLLLLIFFSSFQRLQAQDPPEDFDLYDYATSTNVTIKFSGGTVNDFVNQVKKEAEGLNVLVRSDVQEVTLPALSLRNITADTALNSLNPLSLEAVAVEIDDSAEYYIIGPNYNPDPESVQVLDVAWFLTDGSGEFSPERQEKLQNAIESGQQMLATSSGTMKIYLHEKTGLLFVKGNDEETSLVGRIMEELHNQKNYMRSMKRQQTKPPGASGGGAGAGLDDGPAK